MAWVTFKVAAVDPERDWMAPPDRPIAVKVTRHDSPKSSTTTTEYVTLGQLKDMRSAIDRFMVGE